MPPPPPPALQQQGPDPVPRRSLTSPPPRPALQQQAPAIPTRFESVDVDRLIRGEQAQSTVSKTDSHTALFKKFLETHCFDNTDFETFPPAELDVYLAEFICAVRKVKGGDYDPTTLKSMVHSINRYLQGKDYPESITDKKVFKKLQAARVAKNKSLRKQGKGNGPNTSDALSDQDVETLFAAGVMGDGSPRAISSFLWFQNILLGLRAIKE